MDVVPGPLLWPAPFLPPALHPAFYRHVTSTYAQPLFSLEGGMGRRGMHDNTPHSMAFLHSNPPHSNASRPGNLPLTCLNRDFTIDAILGKQEKGREEATKIPNQKPASKREMLVIEQNTKCASPRPGAAGVLVAGRRKLQSYRQEVTSCERQRRAWDAMQHLMSFKAEAGEAGERGAEEDSVGRDSPEVTSRGKRVRTIFTPEQLERLEAVFSRQQYMVGSERYYLALSLQLSEAQVKVWFQNRRIKWRKQQFEQAENSHGSAGPGYSLSASLSGHGTSLSGHGTSIGGHGTSLGGHGTSLGGHGTSLGGHGIGVWGHGQRLDGYDTSIGKQDHGQAGDGQSLGGHGTGLAGQIGPNNNILCTGAHNGEYRLEEEVRNARPFGQTRLDHGLQGVRLENPIQSDEKVGEYNASVVSMTINPHKAFNSSVQKELRQSVVQRFHSGAQVAREAQPIRGVPSLQPDRHSDIEPGYEPDGENSLSSSHRSESPSDSSQILSAIAT